MISSLHWSIDISTRPSVLQVCRSYITCRSPSVWVTGLICPHYPCMSRGYPPRVHPAIRQWPTMYTTGQVAIQACSKLLSTGVWAIVTGSHNWQRCSYRKTGERYKGRSQSRPRRASSPAVCSRTRTRWKHPASAHTYSPACKIIWDYEVD